MPRASDTVSRGWNWQVALRLGRVSNLPTVWSNTLTGVALAGGAGQHGIAATSMVALSVFYVGGMFLNDGFDANVDARRRPERPIPAGVVTRASTIGTGFALLGLGAVLLAAAGYLHEAGTAWRAPAAGAALAGAIVVYDLHHHGNAWSPLTMGLCRLLVYVTAGLAVAPAVPTTLLAAGGVLLSYLFGMTYIAKQEHRARIEAPWPLVLLGTPFVYLAPHAFDSPLTAGLYLVFAGWVGYALSWLFRRGRTDVPRAVVSLIAAISLLDACILAAHGHAAFAALAVLAFALTLAAQRFVPGT